MASGGGVHPPEARALAQAPGASLAQHGQDPVLCTEKARWGRSFSQPSGRCAAGVKSRDHGAQLV